ncbi:MAG: AMP-binding protein [Cyanobium sp.]
MTLQLAISLEDPHRLWDELQHHWNQGALVGLAPPLERALLRTAVLEKRPGEREATRTDDSGGQSPLRGAPWPWGPAVVLGSGGSSGGRRWCLQPLANLMASAEACGTWLKDLGLDPDRCLHLNALPLHHVSGLMPLIRTVQWRTELLWLPPALLRQPGQLPLACPLPTRRPVLLSLVPTQLQRLMMCPEAISWLKGCAVIWVGGAALAPELAARARDAALPLAPCYGATETAAMVCALPPSRFLAGEGGCGPPLADAELRLEGTAGAIAVRTGRISPGWFAAGRLQPVAGSDGWWCSGDAGSWICPRDPDTAPPTGTMDPRACPHPDSTGRREAGNGGSGADEPAIAATTAGPIPWEWSLGILGRLDGAIQSGGETVFPDEVRLQLLARIEASTLPVAELLVLGETDPDWGERLVALVRWRESAEGAPTESGETTGAHPELRSPWIGQLVDLARDLPPPQRPCRWLHCPELALNPEGKWERQRWRDWAAEH